ncbi:unnamed protein product [marine sediment metagenome]|uniref:DUF5667 domain-containing protein n=1 Tax=marine sediment metagenome TaxID=412755 RepID=X0SQZ6_9ZZZZ
MKKVNFKNLLTIFSALIFGASVVGISILQVSRGEVMAQDEEEVEVIGEKKTEEELMIASEDKGTESAEEAEATKSAEEPASAESFGEAKKVDYYLPYPGILPDHPLYWLKMIRDRIMLAFTKNPVDRYGRLLLYADKRVGAAKVLIEGNKAELGVTTATKAEKYLVQAIDQFKAIDDPGKATPEERQRLVKAAMKHEEVLTGVLDKVPDQSKSALQEVIEKIKENYQGLSD